MARAPLTVTESRVYNAALPAPTASFGGSVSGDMANGVGGSAKRTTTAATQSGVGTYSITVVAGALSACNDGFTLVNGTLNVPGAKAAAFSVVAIAAPVDSLSTPHRQETLAAWLTALENFGTVTAH